MRFFTNDRDQQAREDDHPERVQSEPVPVPAQRPASPWAQSPRHSSDDPAADSSSPDPTSPEPNRTDPNPDDPNRDDPNRDDPNPGGQDPGAQDPGGQDPGGQDPAGRLGPAEPAPAGGQDRHDDTPDRPDLGPEHHPDVEVTPLFGRPPHARGSWEAAGEGRGNALQEPALGDRRPSDQEQAGRTPDDAARSGQALPDPADRAGDRSGLETATTTGAGVPGGQPSAGGQGRSGARPATREELADADQTDANQTDTHQTDANRADTDAAQRPDPERDGLPAAGPANGHDGPMGPDTGTPITLDADTGRPAVGRAGQDETREPDGPEHPATLDAGSRAAAGAGTQGRTPEEPVLDDGGTFEDPVVVASGGDARTFAPTTAAANGQLPGTVPEQTVGPLFADSAAHGFRDRWRDVQLRFVDDPKEAAAEAAALVDEAVDALTENLRTQRAALGGTSEGDTEQLRMRIRAYRDFLDRLLAL